MGKWLVIMSVILLSGCMTIEDWIHDDVNEDFVKRTFRVEQLHEDLDFLVKTMKKRHPAFDQYVDSQLLLNKVNEIKQQITKPLTRKKAFVKLAQLVPLFNDGHSILFPLLAEATYAKQDGYQTFPFSVKIQGGQVYLLHAYSRASDDRYLAKGTQIQAINNHKATDIVAELSTMSHGETKHLRESMLSLLFYYWLHAVYDIKGDIALQYHYNGETKSLTLNNTDQWEKDERENQDYAFSMITSEVGYLRIASFDVDDDSKAYEEFVFDAFEKLNAHKTPQLIIDVRGNTGGQSDAGAEVIQYLIDKPVSQASIAIEKLNEDNTGIFDYKGKPGEIRELDVLSDGLVEPVDTENRYRGNVLVLMDRMTYSAGILFVSTIKDHKLGKIAGEPTGGFANQTGNLAPFHLPNTKLLMLAPERYIIRPSGDKQKRPVFPDYYLHSNATSAQDNWLNEAMRLLTPK